MPFAGRSVIATSIGRASPAAFWLLLGLLIPAFVPLPLCAQGRYVAIFEDGTRAESDRLDKWSAGFDASFSRRPALDAKDTPRTIFDRQNPWRRIGPYLELANGDVLPGRIVGYTTDGENRLGQFKVALEGSLQGISSNSVSVRAAAVARIVGARQPALSQDVAGVLLTDGRRLAPRSQRWNKTGLRMLTEQGFVEAPFAELADVVLAGIDRTGAAVADGQRVQSAGLDRLYRFATCDGAALTTPFCTRQSERQFMRGRERFRPVRAPKSVYVLQPTWSLDSLIVPEEAVCMYGVRRPNELPLSALTAKTLAERSLLGIVHPWRRDQSVRGGLLESAELAADLGLGMHSHCEVSFELPAGALEFTSWVGLDRNVGLGGCVECQVFLDSLSGEPAWQIDFLRGGEEPHRVGPIAVGSAQRLVLVVKFAHDDRPADADPLDIRDEVVWLAPLITVELLQASESRTAN